jgi:multidrug efflux pump subunit AcrB
MGIPVSFMSMFGIVALTGVVVNDALIMIDLINRRRAEGLPLHQVIEESGTRRFRPILLTTLTTFFGLTPMILETSLQAQFLIPMAVSLAFGVLFATTITLILVPALYMILQDVRGLFGFGRSKTVAVQTTAAEAASATA